MGYYRDRVKSFKGKVKIEDVQNEFDILVNAINKNIEKLNSYANLDVNDFYIGSTQIPSSNYTLTLGALKSIISAYNRTTLGGTVVKMPGDNTKCIVFPALIPMNGQGIIQTNTTVLQRPNVNPTQLPNYALFVQYRDGNVGFTNQREFLGGVVMAEIDWLRDEYIMNTTKDDIFVNPDKSPAIMVNTQAWANGNWTYAIGLDNNRSQFLLPQAASLNDNQSSTVQIDGKTIQNAHAGAQNKWHCQTYVYAPIWIPKGLASTVNSYAVSKALYYTMNQRNG